MLCTVSNGTAKSEGRIKEQAYGKLAAFGRLFVCLSSRSVRDGGCKFGAFHTLVP